MQTGPRFRTCYPTVSHCSLVESPAMDFSGRHYPKDLILQTVRWYLRYSLNGKGKRLGRLWVLTLCPVVGVGQEILVDPEDVTVCVGEVAEFTSVVRGPISSWRIDNTLLGDIGNDVDQFIEQGATGLEDGSTYSFLRFLPIAYTRFNNSEVQSTVGSFNGSSETSNHAYLFYKTNHQSPVTGLNVTANDTVIQLNWDASEVRTRYLVSISGITETPVVVSSPQYVYFPESQDWRWYEFMVTMVTTHECFNATNPDTSQTVAASVGVAYPGISHITTQVDDKAVLDRDFNEGAGEEPSKEKIKRTRNLQVIGVTVSVVMTFLSAALIIINLYVGCKKAKQEKINSELRPILQ